MHSRFRTPALAILLTFLAWPGVVLRPDDQFRFSSAELRGATLTFRATTRTSTEYGTPFERPKEFAGRRLE